MKKCFLLLSMIIAMFAVSTAFIACSDPELPPETTPEPQANTTTYGDGLITGYVLDNRGEPVEGAIVTLGTRETTTNGGGQFVLAGIAPNDAALVTAGSSVITGTNTTAYSLTARKEGYLSATVTGVYVTYKESESAESAAYQAALTALQADYKEVLTEYAKALKNGAASSSTSVTVSTENTVTTSTTNKETDADEVFKKISEALADIKNLLSDRSYSKEFYANFAEATLIPCTGSFVGRIKLNTKVKDSSTINATTYAPASHPVVEATYTPTGKTGFYSWSTTVDENGDFKFDKCLPEGVGITYSVDSFFETINGTEYCFSSASGDVIIDGYALPLNEPILKNGAQNAASCIVMLYAQTDKIWVTDTNVETSSTGQLLTTTTPLTFTFNKPMLKLDFDGQFDVDTDPTATTPTVVTYKTEHINLKPSEYTITWSTDKKTATVTPKAGYWTIAKGENPVIVLSGEAEDGSKTFLTKKYSLYFDTKVWISLYVENETAVAGTLDDYNDRIALNSPVKIEFSKPMNDAINLKLAGITNTYTETWNTEKTVLTLTPINTYWIVNGSEVQISVLEGSSKNYYNGDIGYWKTGAAKSAATLTDNDCLKVFFDTFVDVTIENASTATNEAIKLTFSKALKSFTKSDNISAISVGNTPVTDYDVSLDTTKKVVTITSRAAKFINAGKYSISLTGIEAVDGSKNVRENGKTLDISATGYTAGSGTFTTDFAYEGFEFKPISVEVIDSLPSTAGLSRMILTITTDKFLKIEFSKPVQESKITVAVGTGNAVSVKNYIDNDDANVVYIPLDGVKNIGSAIVLGGTAKSTTSETATFNQNNLNTWFDGTLASFYVYAPLSLTGTSLITSLDHVTGEPEYNKADPISAGSAVTFDFDGIPSDCTASYKIFGLEDVDNDAATDIKVLVENGTATISGNRVTISDNALVAKKTVGSKAIYYIELRINNSNGVKLFSTTNPYFGSIAGSFEAIASQKGIFDAPASNNPDSTPNTHKNYGSFIVEVAEKDHLVATSLITKETTLFAKPEYSAADPVAAKSVITFEFDDLTRATARYELYDLASTSGSNAPQVISSGNATVNASSKTVTVQDNLLVSGSPTVAGKTFNVAIDTNSGITTYYLKLEVKKGGNVIFSSDNDWWTTPVGNAADTRTDFQKELSSIVSNGKFKIEVAPMAIDELSFIDENEDAFGTALKTYKASDGINPKASVTITFNAQIPAGAKYSYEIRDSNAANAAPIDESVAGGVSVTSATNTVTIQSDKMLASTAEKKNYYITLKIVKNNETLFDTNTDYFGKASEYEKEMAKTAIGAIASKSIVVPVIKTYVVTTNTDDESLTTTADGFKESFNTPIVLQFSHPVTGYKAVLYKVSGANNTPTNVYTVASNPQSWTAPVEESTTAAATTFTDFKAKNAEYIIATSNDGTVSTDGYKMTITPTSFFEPGSSVMIAVFDNNGNYLNVKNDATPPDVIKYTAENDASKFNEELTAAAGNLTVKTETDNIGDGQRLVISVPTKLSAKTDEVAQYQLFVKNAESTYFTEITNAANTLGWYDPDNDSSTNNSVFVGLDSFDNDNKIATGNGVTRTNKILGRADNAHFQFNLAADAFGIRGGNVVVLLLEKLDGAFAAYKATLSDGSKPEGIQVSNVVTTGTPVSAVSQSAITVTNIADPATAANATDVGDFQFNLAVSGQIIKSAVATWKEHKTGTGVGAETSSANFETVYSPDSKSATINVKNARFFAGDKITIKVTDTSGNYRDFDFTVQ